MRLANTDLMGQRLVKTCRTSLTILNDGQCIFLFFSDRLGKDDVSVSAYLSNLDFNLVSISDTFNHSVPNVDDSI